ncbi:MAG TPA: NIPSNAP family protein [Thermoanaerobaculia bacterium]
MNLELRIYKAATAQRWRWLPPASREGVVAAFLSYRDDDTFVELTQPGAPLVDTPTTRVRITPAYGNVDRVAQITEANMLEVRQYRIVPGQRARFAKFFAERTLEPQTRCGITIYGQYDSLDDENQLVWFRGFPSLQQRDVAKAAFYESPLWLNELEAEAFSMIEDYSNSVLVAPLR